jgi:DNA primase
VRYPQEFIDKVSEASNIVEIISQYTQLKPSGGGYMGRCPFPDHREKTPSFSVSEAKQVYHCFGCKKSGNVFRFLQDFSGLNFPEALEYLADRYGVPVPQVANPEAASDAQRAQDRKKTMLRANKLAAEFFSGTLKSSHHDSPIRNYVRKRGLLPETIDEFQIGYAPPEWDSLVHYLDRHKIPLLVAEEAKLVSAKKDRSGFVDFFRDRLMFPIHSPAGDVLAFGGRIHDQGEPKYKNSPETSVFIKGKVLYGLHQTARHIRAEDGAIIVEGYMDLVSVYQAGIKNLAATMGTALTSEHAKLIKRMTNNVVVLFDSDEAGQRAAERSLIILLEQGLYPRGIVFSEAKDPDEFITKFGVAALRERLQSAPELFALVLKTWMQVYRGEATQKVKLLDQVKPVFDAIGDPRLKSLYAEDLAQRMGVTLEWLRGAFRSTSSATGGSAASAVVPPRLSEFDSENHHFWGAGG